MANQDGMTHTVLASVSHGTPALSTWPLQHCAPPPGALPQPPPPHWPQASGQQAWPLRMPSAHQPRNGGSDGGAGGAGSVAGGGGEGGGASGMTHAVSTSEAQGRPVLSTWPEQHCVLPPGAEPQPPPPHWPHASGQQALPLLIPWKHQPWNGGEGGPTSSPGVGVSGTTHAVSAIVWHVGAKLSTRPEQHWSRPPGAEPQPPPPHWPQEAGQHASPLRMPSAHQPWVVGDGAAADGGEGGGTTHAVSVTLSHAGA